LRKRNGSKGGWFVRGFLGALIVCAMLVLVLILGRPADAGELLHQAMPSGALQRELPYLIYLPDDYTSGNRRYPVLYLLHGAGGDESIWVERGTIKERADRLIASGAIPPAIIVMPGCPGAWWVDGAKDKAETAFWSELVPFIDKTYRTIDSRLARLVAGISAGGYGAVRYGLKYPDRLAAVAALSPAIYAVTPPVRSSARRDPAFLRPDGLFNQTLWTAENYPRLASRYFDQETRVPFYLVSADGDELGIAYETALLFKTISDQQPEQVELRIVDGKHDWSVWSTTLDDAMKYVFRFVPRPHAGLQR
jgi:enterochelin esterase-like enzyme